MTKYLDSWKAICDGYPKGGAIGELEQADRFRWLAASRSTIIQSSNTHVGLCHDPQTVLDELFKEFVQ